jgi:hypothetical protein
MGQLRRFLRLPVAQRRLLIAALVLVSVARVILPAFGFQRSCRWFRKLFPHQPVRIGEVEAGRCAESIARLVERAAWNVWPGATCLPQSFALWALLRRQGLDPRMRIGIRKNTTRLEAHAWVEVSPGTSRGNAAGEEMFFCPFDLSDLISARGTARADSDW